MRVAILLAAGSSRRFGAPNKLFARFGSRTLLEQAIRIAGRAPVQRLIVIVGSQAERVTAQVRSHRPDAVVVRARGHREGLGGSLRAASRRLRPIDRAAFVFLADMPWLQPEAAQALTRIAAPQDAMVRPAYRGRPGHPVLLGRDGLRALSAMRGDEGPGRSLIKDVRLVRGSRRCIADVDRPAALRRAVARLW